MGPTSVRRGVRAAPFLAPALAALSVLAACAGGAGGAAPSPSPTPRSPSAEQRARTATAEDWAGTPASRLEELFVGRFPGVRVVAAPGGIQVRIRGQSSINGPNTPLYIVDGMPYDATNGLLSINPHDVAKIEVLKDIGSTAYYGVRGANGVVVITTKRPGR
jgi:TonB-dependent SusC/RagA subfamily outer membrane receptor